jgi:outer membrane immunogenic protein
MKVVIRFAAVFLALASIAGAASAQEGVIGVAQPKWSGFFVGANLGGVWNNTCNSWEAGPVIMGSPELSSAFNARNCPSNGSFLGGVQLGYMFQSGQWVWGLGVDYDIWSSKNHTKTYTYAGASPPPDGTYTFAGKGNPDGLLLLGPRIGYTWDTYLAYLRIGGAFTSGSHTTSASFTDDSGTASFSGGKNFSSNGFNVGFGLAYGFAQHWALGGEYNYLKFGKSSNSVTSCTGSAATCTEFADFSLDSIHNSVTANMFRVLLFYSF